MQTNNTSGLYNEGFQIQIVHVTTITEYTGQITSIYDDNGRSIVQRATTLGTMKNGQNAAEPPRRHSVLIKVPSPGCKQVLNYTKQEEGRVGK